MYRFRLLAVVLALQSCRCLCSGGLALAFTDGGEAKFRRSRNARINFSRS